MRSFERSSISGGKPSSSGFVSSLNNRLLLRHEHHRPPEIDEPLLVLPQLLRGLTALRRGTTRRQHLRTLPPKLRHTVKDLAVTAPAGTERLVQRRLERVHLHISLDSERSRAV